MSYRIPFIIGICFMSFFTNELNAQNVELRNKNNIFFEVFGSAVGFSINYDRMIYENYSLRFGGMIYNSEGKITGSFPLLINKKFYLTRDYIELGAGATYYSLKLNIMNTGGEAMKGFIPTVVIGYCFQSDLGINGRICFTPFYFQNKLYPFGGFGIGYSF